MTQPVDDRPSLAQSPDAAAAGRERSRLSRSAAAHPVVLVAGLVLVTVVCAGVVAWIGTHDVRPFPDDAIATALVVPVGHKPDAAEFAVQLTLESGAALQIRAPRAGALTSSRLVPGLTLGTGDVPFRIEDRPVVALQASAPFWRDLHRGDHGSDVRRLQNALREAKLGDVRPTGRFDARTAAAVRALYRRAGLPPRDALIRSDVVWIGPRPLPVAAVKAGVGDDPGAGGVVAEGPARPTRVVIASPVSGMPRDAQPRELVVGDAVVALATGQAAVTEADQVGRIATAMQGQPQGTGQIRLVEPVDVLSVPGTAVITDGSGHTCVFADARSRPTPVQPVGGSLGEVYVPRQTGLSKVLANPSDVLTSPSCG